MLLQLRHMTLDVCAMMMATPVCKPLFPLSSKYEMDHRTEMQVPDEGLVAIEV